MRSKKYRIATLKGWIGQTPEGSARLNKNYQTFKQEIKDNRLLNIETWY